MLRLLMVLLAATLMLPKSADALVLYEGGVSSGHPFALKVRPEPYQKYRVDFGAPVTGYFRLSGQVYVNSGENGPGYDNFDPFASVYLRNQSSAILIVDYRDDIANPAGGYFPYFVDDETYIYLGVDDGTPGSFFILRTTPAIPEPATWVMLIPGFGAAGVSLRSLPGRRTHVSN